MDYLRFILENRRFLGFGFLLTFVSSFGQTYFIGLFAPQILVEFALTHGTFGSIYSTATLASAFFLMWIGRRIDNIDLRFYSLGACFVLISACFFVSLATSITGLLLAFFALRLSGQGLMGHISSVSMARYFDRQRGKAVSIAAMGRTAGEAVFPSLVIALIATLGWRQSWMGFGIVSAVVLPGLVLWLLKGHKERHRTHQEQVKMIAQEKDARQWARHEVLRDPRFHMVLPAALMPAFLLSGFFFHHAHFAATKEWSLEWFALCFTGYAAATLASSLAIGVLVDRHSAVRLFPYYLFPLALGTLCLALFAHPGAAMAYMLLSGIAVGGTITIAGSLWAEVYGVAHHGAIRALTSSLMVFSTALSPAAMGWLIDLEVDTETIAFGASVLTLASMVLARAARLGPESLEPPS
jgi:MFS family permease